MTDISRRALLRGVTFAGAASVGGAAGVGTHALLTDAERFESNSAASGALDLQVATRTTVDGRSSATPEQDGEFPSAYVSESTVTLEFPDVDPSAGSASGSATVAYRVCDNPGRVWLRTDGDSSPLADAVGVTVTHQPDCGTDGSTVYEGTLSGFVEAFEAGARLGCRELGKVELDDGAFVVETDDGSGDSLAVDDVPGSLALDGPDGPVTVEITGVSYKDDGAEVRGVDLASEDVTFCRVDVKGGGQQNTSGGAGGGGGGGGSGSSDGTGGTGSEDSDDDGTGSGDSGSGTGGDPSGDGVETYRLGCTDSATGLTPGENPGGEPSGLSHFVVYACPEDCRGCEPACLVVDWTLPDPEPVAGESVAFDLELHASQCRHTEATNPW